MAATVPSEVDPAVAAARLHEKFCLVLMWDWHSGAAQLRASEHLPCAELVATFKPEAAMLLILAQGLAFPAARAWVAAQGLRGLVQFPDGTICMWSGGEPTLEYGSEDWHVLAAGTRAAIRFTAATRPEVLLDNLPPFREILADAVVRDGDEHVS